MTFASRYESFKRILAGDKTVECGGKRCHAMVTVSDREREMAKFSRLGITIVLCENCKKKIGAKV